MSKKLGGKLILRFDLFGVKVYAYTFGDQRNPLTTDKRKQK